jgi:hypothetical protein
MAPNVEKHRLILLPGKYDPRVVSEREGPLVSVLAVEFVGVQARVLGVTQEDLERPRQGALLI